MTCGTCGAELPARARFCPACGAPAAGQRDRDVRKTVTLLFTDLSGSTALGEQLDPESYRSLLGRYFAVSRAAVERHGGTVEKFVGDAVLAVFGVPEVHEDDALRAVRAAQELRAALRGLSAEIEGALGVRLEIRTGVNTGSVVTGAARAGGSFATGDAVNTAARLEQAAGPGEVLLGESTYALVRDAVTATEVEPVHAKGKRAPVRAYRLDAVDVAAEGRQRRLHAELIGRDRETRALDDALEHTVAGGRGHLVTVTGAPGIGKSRLVAALVERVGDRAEVLRGRCVSYGQGITYWPIVQLLREAARLGGDESPEVRRHALLALLPGSAADRDAVDLLIPLLGPGGEPASGADTAWAVTRVLEQLALRRPLVLVLDDLHWAEPTLLDLLEQVREETKELPLLLVCAARPELLEQRPGWGHGADEALALEPFDVAATATSLAALLGPGVPGELAEAVAAWSGGNPLFVEEIATHVVDTGVLARGEDGWALTGDLADAGVPGSVSALLAARLDRLPAPERDLLERISVIGLEHTAEEAAQLAAPGADVPGLLTALAQRDLLRRVSGPGAETWAFRHALVRDAAYDALPKAERARLHARFAEQLGATQGRAGGEHLAFVAHHLAQAAAYAEVLAPQAPETRARAETAARSALAAAADARLREDLAGAAALVERVLRLPATRATRLRVVTMLHSVHESYDQAALVRLLAVHEELVGEAAGGLEREHLRMHRAQCGVLDEHGQGDPEELCASAERMAELARAAGDHRREALAARSVVDARNMTGEYGAIGAWLIRVGAVGDAHDRRVADQWLAGLRLYGPSPLGELRAWAEEGRAAARTPRARTMMAIFVAAAAAGRGDDDAATLLEAVLADELSTATMEHTVVTAFAVLMSGRTAQARHRFDGVVAQTHAAGDTIYASTYLAWSAMLDLELDEPLDPVEAKVDQAAAWTSPYDAASVALVAAARAVLAHRRGRSEEAVTHARAALETPVSEFHHWAAADARRWVSEVFRDVDPAEEHRLLTEALALYDDKELRTWRAGVVERLGMLDR